MSTDATAGAGRARRIALLAGAIAVLALLLALSLRVALQPARVTRVVLDQLGKSLGLEIAAQGIGEYRLRGTPTLVVRDVVARGPGAAVPLLRAERVYISLPWSTLRSRGEVLEIRRIELDAPVMDLPAFRTWRAARPPGRTRVPTLIDGMAVARGRIDNGDWRVERISLTLPSLHPDRPVDARFSGIYRGANADPPLTAPFDLAVSLTRPARRAGLGISGNLTLDRGKWQVASHLRLSGPFELRQEIPWVHPARIAIDARYAAAETRIPFALGLAGPLRFDAGTLTIVPAGIAMRGDGVVPDFDGHGRIAFGRGALLDIDGVLAAWPEAWPALPAPIGTSTSPLPFALSYAGRDFSGIASLLLRRDATRLDARFRLPDVIAWTDGDTSPLPPLDGRLATPRMRISGAELEGVELELDDPGVSGTSPVVR